MTTQRANLWIFVMFAATLAYAAIVYPQLPDRIPTHWNIRGEIDGWGSKNTIFIGPSLVLFALVLLHGLPKLSPQQFSIDTFRATFNLIMVTVGALFTFIGTIIIRSSSHHTMDVGKWMVMGIGLFIALLGNLMGKTRRNFYVGIRTPWTLASEKVWDVTHRLGARWMVGGGVASAILALLGAHVGITITTILVTSLYPVVFSYFYYKRLERTGGL